MPVNASGQADTVWITATSVISPAVWAGRDVTLVDLGVRLAPDFNRTIAAGSVLTYSHVLTNLSTVADTYEFALESSRGWAGVSDGQSGHGGGGGVPLRWRCESRCLSRLRWVWLTRQSLQSHLLPHPR